MEALFSIISQIISFVNLQINDALKDDIRRRVFLKEGEIQGAVTDNTQSQYGNLESEISQAAIVQYQEQTQAEASRKVLTGNLVSIAVAVLIVVVVVVLMFWLTKKSK